MPPLLTRRRFLVAGLAGGVALSAAGWWAWSRRETSAAATALAPEARVIVRAIVPAMLGPALPASNERTTAIDETVTAVEHAVAGLPPSSRAELGELFTLLSLYPGRRAFAGIASPWEEAGPDEVAAFLDRWRASSWALKRTAYDALHQLIMAAWYANPRSWTSIGYAGPPDLGA